MIMPPANQSRHRGLDRAGPRSLRRAARRLALPLALAVTLVWALLTWKEDHHVFAWDRPVRVTVVALVDAVEGRPASEDERFARRFLSRAARPRRNLREVESWLGREYARWTGDDRVALRFSVRGPLPLDHPAPRPPAADDGFFERWARTNELLDYFSGLAEREDLHLGAHDVLLFVFFYDPFDPRRRERFGERDSLASRRNRLGVVFAPIRRSLLGRTCALAAHEICHTLGASDKYDEKGSVWPAGFVEPDREPRYPQRHAEIMALARPLSSGEEEIVSDLCECRVGRASARELNWTAPRPRAPGGERESAAPRSGD